MAKPHLPPRVFEVAGKNFRHPLEACLLAAVVHFVICFGLSMRVRRLQAKIASSRRVRRERGQP